jgi:hypothetical protein
VTPERSEPIDFPRQTDYSSTVKALLPSGNAIVIASHCKATHIPTVHFPRQVAGLSPLNGSVTSTHGTVINLVALYASASPIYYILQYFATPADIARWVYIDQNFIAPPANIVAEGWTVNFYYKRFVLDKLTSAQFAAL